MIHWVVWIVEGFSKDEYSSSASPKFITENSSGVADVLILESCGHMPHEEKPQEVIDVSRKFLCGIA